MKKLIALTLAVIMVCALFVACGDKTPAKANYEGTMEELTNAIAEANPVEFMAMTTVLDLTDTSEDGEFMLQYFTGLLNGEKFADVAGFEPMMSSQAFSLVLMRVAEGNEPQAVAQEVKDSVDARKWVCVEADQKMVAGYGDVIMLIMVESSMGLTAQSYVDAFQNIVGELDFVI